MEIVTGVEIDVTKSSTSDWSLYFTAGEFKGPGYLKTSEPFTLKLDPQDYSEVPTGSAWHVMYNYRTGAISLSAPEEKRCPGVVDIGGFIKSSDCDIKFIYPVDDCIVYNRLFSNEHSSDYDQTNSNYSKCEPCAGAFSAAFSISHDVHTCTP